MHQFRPLVLISLVCLFAALHAPPSIAQGTYPAPTITNFSPHSAAADQDVSIQGTNFFPPLSIIFGGGIKASTYSQVNNSLTVLIPIGAQTGPITITAAGGNATTTTDFTVTFSHVPFFLGESALSNGVYYLQFPSNAPFGYYSYLSNPNYIYHFDLGYECVFDAADGKDGVYFYDFASSTFFYTSPTFGFPYLYDFTLKSVVYYYPDPNNPGRYNTDGVRYFYVFNTGQVITK